MPNINAVVYEMCRSTYHLIWAINPSLRSSLTKLDNGEYVVALSNESTKTGNYNFRIDERSITLIVTNSPTLLPTYIPILDKHIERLSKLIIRELEKIRKDIIKIAYSKDRARYIDNVNETRQNDQLVKQILNSFISRTAKAMEGNDVT